MAGGDHDDAPAQVFKLVADDPVYEVLPAHLEVLTARGFTYEVVPVRPRRPENYLAARLAPARGPAARSPQ